MNENHQTVDDSCSACPMSDCRDRKSDVSQSDLVGWRFALSSATVFLLPLILGILGAALIDGSDTQRFIGGSLGLFGGMAVTAICFRLFGRNQQLSTDNPSVRE